MSNINQARSALIWRISHGDECAPCAERQAAFDNSGLSGALSRLVAKVATQPHRVTGDDIAAAKASGLTEDQIFELVVCAALGQANRQYETAVAALEAAVRER